MNDSNLPDYSRTGKGDYLPALFILVLVGLVAILLASAWSYHESGDTRQFVGSIAVASFIVFIILFAINGTRFWWAGRLVSFTIFFLYLLYVLDTWFWHTAPLGLDGPRSEVSRTNAVLGFIVFGLPALVFAFRGRTTTKPDAPPCDNEESSTD